MTSDLGPYGPGFGPWVYASRSGNGDRVLVSSDLGPGKRLPGSGNWDPASGIQVMDSGSLGLGHCMRVLGPGIGDRGHVFRTWDPVSAIGDLASGIRCLLAGVRHPFSGIWIPAA